MMRRRLLIALVLAMPQFAAAADGSYPLHTWTQDRRIGGAALSPDGKIAMTWTLRQVRFWDVATGNIILENQSELISAACGNDVDGSTYLSPDGALLAMACIGNDALVDLRIPAVVARIGNSGGSRWMAFDAGQNRLARVSSERSRDERVNGNIKSRNTFEVFDIEPYTDPSWFGALMRDWFGYDSESADEIMTSDGLWSDEPDSLVFSSEQSQMLFESRNGTQVVTIGKDGASQNSQLETASTPIICDENNAMVVSRAKANMLQRIRTAVGGEPRCRLNHAATRVVMATNREISLWDVESGEEQWNYQPTSYLSDLEATPNLERIAYASDRGNVGVLSSDGALIATGSVSGEAMRMAVPQYSSCDHGDRLALSANGRTVILVYCNAFVWQVP